MQWDWYGTSMSPRGRSLNDADARQRAAGAAA